MQPTFAVIGDVLHDFTAAHREANQRDVAQVERLYQAGQILRQCFVVITGNWLVTFAETAAIVLKAAHTE